MRLKIIGYQMRYEGWSKDCWEFSRNHPGPIPEGHASRIIRPVYINVDEKVERQEYIRKFTPVCPYDDPDF